MCFDLHDFSHTHQNEGYDQVFNIALFWFPIRCCAVIQHDISCICVSYFSILCSQSAVPFLEGKKGESHNKAWLTRPPPVPLLSDNASMTSTLEGGPRRGGTHAMLVSIMKVTIQTWRGGSRTLISIGPGLQNIWRTSLDCCPLFPPFHCLATDNKLHRPPAPYPTFDLPSLANTRNRQQTASPVADASGHGRVGCDLGFPKSCVQWNLINQLAVDLCGW